MKTSRGIATLVLVASLIAILPDYLLAADFWSKPFADWSDKDVQKILTSSPWSRTAILSTGPPAGASHGADRRGSTIEDNPAGMRVPDPRESAAGVEPGQRGGSAGDEDRQPAGAQVKLTIQWRTALPVKQALARVKYGAEAATSAEARQFLAVEESNYVIAALGIPKAMLPGNETAKKSLLDHTALTVSGNGKPPIRPNDAEFRVGNSIDVFFIFPKGALSLDDKDVEFSIKLAPLTVKERFHLKDMLIGGKLEL